MGFKAWTVAVISALALVGCQNNTDQDFGQNDNIGVEQTRFGSYTDYPTSEGDNDVLRHDNGLDYETDNTNYNNQAVPERRLDENGNNNNQYDVSERAAERITRQLQSVDNAYVLTLEENAFVAVEGDKQQNGEERVENQIRDLVRATDRNINNVYISMNPDFVDLAKNYTENVRDGEPIAGFFEQFGSMMERIFPEAH
ncbi:YhcN/YlaJ family sporulation lipoprotein [Radiobacillus kanasensis]|uniref:YhcN/YlaJ family sporulation lipoprotein n=1 Tax=Radiobacillus kanasensis TaxID=2844358 RepID=UPI001E2EB1B5|nr:YhcN/YlaJ family sporulation lipoprotein [Radiobacillus kanasensis]UFU00409.1 YhcN/YlaJ family sporulation lipoprotein [Radiobacillus kanasensis]